MKETRTRTAGTPGPHRRALRVVPLYLLSAVVLVAMGFASLAQRASAPLTDSEFVFTVTAAVVYWGLATFVFVPRLGRPAVRAIWGAFLLYALAASCGLMVGLEGWDRLYPVCFLAAYAFLPVCFLSFALRFPTPWSSRAARWTVVGGLMVVGVAGGAHDIVRYFHVSPERQNALPSLWLVAPFALGLLLGIARLVHAGRHASLARERRQAKWILWGTALGTAPYVLLRSLPRILTGWESPVPVEVDRAAELLVPIAFAIAVVKDRVFDIDVIIRRSILYSLMALCGAAAFAVIVAVLAVTVRRWTDVPGEAIGGAAAAIAVGVFVPLRRRFGTWVDRTFFGIRYRHDQALAALRSQLAPATSPADLAERLRVFLQDLGHVNTCAVLVREDAGWRHAGALEPAVAAAMPGVLGAAAVPRDRPWARAGATAMPEFESPPFPDLLGEADIRVVQALGRGEAVWGYILLGPKRNERTYVEEELRVLSASALQAARALERLSLHRKIAKEAMARESLEDLQAQKARFFARVAHDLRTPLTAIHWSLRNLQEGLAGPLNEAQADYLDSVGAAERQLGRLVDNLVDLSRLDLDAATPPAVPVDMETVVRETEAALRPLARLRGNTIAIACPPGLPPVAGRPEAAAQIAMNLVDNALKYAPEGTAVDVALSAQEDRVALIVRDHGAGLPPGDSKRLFELFHQGTDSLEVGRKGFGIGLHIVQAWTNAMGGAVEADDHPDGGARFTCRLPIWREEAS